VTEDEELYALVLQAFDLRGGPYLIDAATAIVDWHERRHLRWLERWLEEASEVAGERARA
jgi:hypothetical protein